jgi:hypothetical protein
MTRDEAKQRCASLLAAMDKGLRSEDRATLLVDGFVCLGILKLDEPKNPEAQAGEIIGAYCSGSDAAAILQELSDAGLEIVERKFRNAVNFRWWP